MKRRASGQKYSNRPFKKPRTVYRAPTRAYKNSKVPLRSYGYRPNSGERKVADIAANAATVAVSTTGSFTLMAVPTVGADYNQRVGRKILLKSFYIRGRVIQDLAQGVDPGAGVVQPQMARMIIFADLQPNGATPAVTDLLVTPDVCSHLNLNNRDRFRIYTDKEYVFDPYMFGTNFASASRQIHAVKKFKKINLEMVFSTSTGAIADITSGALYMFWLGSNIAGNEDLACIYSTRVRYEDKN